MLSLLSGTHRTWHGHWGVHHHRDRTVPIALVHQQAETVRRSLFRWIRHQITVGCPGHVNSERFGRSFERARQESPCGRPTQTSGSLCTSATRICTVGSADCRLTETIFRSSSCAARVSKKSAIDVPHPVDRCESWQRAHAQYFVEFNADPPRTEIRRSVEAFDHQKCTVDCSTTYSFAYTVCGVDSNSPDTIDNLGGNCFSQRNQICGQDRLRSTCSASTHQAQNPNSDEGIAKVIEQRRRGVQKRKHASTCVVARRPVRSDVQMERAHHRALLVPVRECNLGYRSVAQFEELEHTEASRFLSRVFFLV